MRKIREVLRLKFDCAPSGHQIAHSCQISRITVADYLCRFEKARLGWPLPQDLSEEEQGRRVTAYPCRFGAPGGRRLALAPIVQ